MDIAGGLPCNSYAFFFGSVNQQLLRLVLKVNAGLLCPKSCIHIVSMLNPFWVSEFASGCTTIE